MLPCKAGSKVFSVVFTNFHPDLYAHMNDGTLLMRELVTFLALAPNAEPLGVFETEIARALTFNVRGKLWALESVLDHISTGTVQFSSRIVS